MANIDRGLKNLKFLLLSLFFLPPRGANSIDNFDGGGHGLIGPSGSATGWHRPQQNQNEWRAIGAKRNHFKWMLVFMNLSSSSISI